MLHSLHTAGKVNSNLRFVDDKNKQQTITRVLFLIAIENTIKMGLLILDIDFKDYM